MADRVQRGHHHIWGADIVRLHLDLWHLRHPQTPLSLDGHLQSCDGYVTGLGGHVTNEKLLLATVGWLCNRSCEN